MTQSISKGLKSSFFKKDQPSTPSSNDKSDKSDKKSGDKSSEKTDKSEKKSTPSPITSGSLFSTLDTSDSHLLTNTSSGGSRLSVSSVAKQLKEKQNVNNNNNNSAPTSGSNTPPLSSTQPIKTMPYRPIKSTNNNNDLQSEKIDNSTGIGKKPINHVTMSTSTPTLPSVLNRFKNPAQPSQTTISTAQPSPTFAPVKKPPSQYGNNSNSNNMSPTLLSASTEELPSGSSFYKKPPPPLPISKPRLSESYDSSISGNSSTSSSLASSTSSLPSYSPLNNSQSFNRPTPPTLSRQNTASPTQFNNTTSPTLKSSGGISQSNPPSNNNSPTFISQPTPSSKPAAKKPALPPRNELQSSSGVIVVPKLKPTTPNQHKPNTTTPTSPSNEAQRLFLKKVINEDEEKSNSSDEEVSPRNSSGTSTPQSSTTPPTTTSTSTTPSTPSSPTVSSSSSSSKKVSDPKSDMIQRNYLVQELLSTEKKYVNNLNRIITIFLMPLRNKVTAKDKILNMEEINQIFSNIETIFNIHKTFLVDFEQRIEKWTDTAKIGDVFIKMSPYLNSYKIYSNAYNGSMLTIRSLMKSSPSFATFLQKCLEKPASKGLNLSAYLIMPIQRIPRYRLLLESIIKYTPPDHIDYQDLVIGNQEISKSAIEIDENLAQYQIAHKVLDIQNSLNGLDEDIVTPTRHFIKEGDLKKISDRVVNTRHFVLFNDMLIYCKKERKNTYRFKASFPLLECWVKDIPDTQRFNNLFQIISIKKTYFLSAPSIDEKHQWMKLLNEVIDKMVQQNPDCLQHRQSIYERRGSMSPAELFNTLEKSIPIGSENVNTNNNNNNNNIDITSSNDSNCSNSNGHNSVGPGGFGSLMNNAGGSSSGNLNSSKDNNANNDLKTKSIWLKDQMVKACMLCTTNFTMTRRRHHCRKCGRIFCNDCCPVQDLSHYLQGKKVRVCKTCFEEIEVQLSVMSTMEEIRIEEESNSFK